MPILPSEPDLFPDAGWPADSDLAGRWWCLHTRPRQEKATARDLRSKRVGFYLPQVIHEGVTPQGRKTRSVLPLFPGYVFLFGGDPERLTALKGNRLVKVLEVSDQRGFDHDLRQIHRMLASGLAVVPEPTIPIGARIRIVTGPLSGMVGTVVRSGKRNQFVAVVNFLGQGATVDLLDWQFETVA
jgi:transcriptional antiterminator RfaH